jgi:hypothetical protein
MAGISSKVKAVAIAAFLGESGFLQLKELECCDFTTAHRQTPAADGSLSTCRGGLIHNPAVSPLTNSKFPQGSSEIPRKSPIRVRREA